MSSHDRRQKRIAAIERDKAAIASREQTIAELAAKCARLERMAATMERAQSGMSYRRATVSGGNTGRTASGGAKPIERRPQYASDSVGTAQGTFRTSGSDLFAMCVDAE